MDGNSIYNKVLRRQSCTLNNGNSFKQERRKSMSKFLLRRKQSIYKMMHTQPMAPTDSPEILLLKKKVSEKERLFKQRWVFVLSYLSEWIKSLLKFNFQSRNWISISSCTRRQRRGSVRSNGPTCCNYTHFNTHIFRHVGWHAGEIFSCRAYHERDSIWSNWTENWVQTVITYIMPTKCF